MPTHPSLPSRSVRRALAACTAGALLAVLALPLQGTVSPRAARLGAQEPVPADSALARQQLDVGEQWFRAACLECHATSLGDPDFRLKWGGKSAYDLFELIRSTMPEHEPGSLSLPTYASIVAYLMKLNGMPVGARVIPADQPSLAAITLVFTPGASARSSTPR